MRFSYVTLYVRDLDRSLAFYRDVLGLGVLRRFPTGEGEIAFVGVDGEQTIELIASPRHKDMTYSGFTVGIAVPSLPEATERLAAAGHPRQRGPISPDGHTAFSYFFGPDGEEIQLIEHGH